LGAGFNPEFTGRENVFMNGAILGFSRSEIKRRFDEIAAFADIGDFIEQPVKTYSSGMQMRLAFSVSICLEPEVLIIDEALSVGDAVFQFKCKDRLQDVIEKGTTLLFVSHDMSAVKAFCTRAIYMDKGQKRMEGEPESIAEFYFMDVHAEQTRNLRQKSQDQTGLIQQKSGGGYGTDEGEIVSACFSDTRGTRSSYRFGEMIEFEVVCRYRDHIRTPCLSVVVQAVNLVGIGGRWFGLDRPREPNETVALRIRFPAKFNQGRYFVTLRLEDRRNPKQSFILHKIPGFLSFDIVNAGDESLLGFRDLGLEQVV
jgi:lipopolysaccharide transport system ATP-binding protein